MGLYRRGKIWWISYMVPGVGQLCKSTGTTNRRQAKQILDIRRAEIHEGRFSSLLKSHAPTMKVYISEYLESRTDLHPNTRTRYGVSRRSLEDFFAATRLPDHFLNERKERVQARPFTLEQEQRLLSVTNGYLRPLLILLLDSGLRPNAEALPLKWRDVDFERGMITVIASKTPAGLRTVPMTTRLKAELLRWKSLTGLKNSEFVFFYPRNPAKHLLQVPKTWARALKDAKVAKRRLYDCRSTFCSRMYAAGIQPVLIELLMGHAGSGLVHSYAKADDDFKRDAAAKLEAFMASRTSAENTSIPSTAKTTWVN
jgi:integrase